MFEPKIDELVAVMARDRNRRTQEGRAIDLALAVLNVLGERGTITGAEVCNIAAVLGYDSTALATAWKTRAPFDMGCAKALDAPLARVLPLR